MSVSGEGGLTVSYVIASCDEMFQGVGRRVPRQRVPFPRTEVLPRLSGPHSRASLGPRTNVSMPSTSSRRGGKGRRCHRSEGTSCRRCCGRFLPLLEAIRRLRGVPLLRRCLRLSRRLRVSRLWRNCPRDHLAGGRRSVWRAGRSRTFSRTIKNGRRQSSERRGASMSISFELFVVGGRGGSFFDVSVVYRSSDIMCFTTIE